MAAEKHPVCYVLVRRDLPKTRQAIDVGHAAQECVRTAPADKRTALRVLWVKDEVELVEFAQALSAKKYNFDVVYEPDEPYCGQAMSLGVEPITERLSGLGRMFYHLDRMDLDKMSQPYKKRITVKQLAELLMSQPPEVQEKEVQYADFSWEFPEDVRVCSGQFDDMVTIVGG